MKEYKTVKVAAIPAVEEHEATVLSCIKCDICGGIIEEGHYEIDEVKIEYTTGTKYPESGHEKLRILKFAAIVFIYT